MTAVQIHITTAAVEGVVVDLEVVTEAEVSEKTTLHIDDHNERRFLNGGLSRFGDDLRVFTPQMTLTSQVVTSLARNQNLRTKRKRKLAKRRENKCFKWVYKHLGATEARWHIGMSSASYTATW